MLNSDNVIDGNIQTIIRIVLTQTCEYLEIFSFDIEHVSVRAMS